MADRDAFSWKEAQEDARRQLWGSVKETDGLLAYVVEVHLGGCIPIDQTHVHCPLPGHQDDDPSFRIEGERWVCSCTNGRGDIGDLLEAAYRISNSEALLLAQQLREEFEESGYEPPTSDREDRVHLPPEVLWSELQHMTEAAALIDGSRTDPLCRLLAAKGLLGRLDPQALSQSFGLRWNQSGQVVAPHFDRQETLTGYKIRTHQWYARKGSRFPDLYGAWRNTGQPKVIVAEGETDTWLLDALMQPLGWDVLGLPTGAHRPRQEWIELLSGRHVVLAFDADDAGRRAARAWAQQLDGIAASITVARFDNGTDACTTSDPKRSVRESLPVTKSTSRVVARSTENRYYFVSKKVDRPISNFIFVPDRLVRYVDDPDLQGYIGHFADDPGREVVLHTSDLTSDAALRKWAARQPGGRSWKGSGNASSDLAEMLRSEGPFLPEVRVARISGLHDGVFVLPDRIVGPAGAEIQWRYEPLNRLTGVRTASHTTSEPPLPDVGAETLRSIVESLHTLNHPATITPILAWLAAATLRSRFDQFPILAILGNTGAGKTATIELLLGVWWNRGEVQNLGSTTKFVDSVALTSSNVFPVAFDEYRTGATPQQRNRVLETDELIRSAYRKSGSLKRGESTRDGTGVRAAPISRPLIIAGETIFEDQAVRHRSVIVVPQVAERKTDAFRHLQSLNVSGVPGGLGLAFLKWLVTERSEYLRGDELLQTQTSDRPSHNTAVLRFGWQLLSDFTREHLGIEITVGLDLSRVEEHWQQDTDVNNVWLDALHEAFEGNAPSPDGTPIVFRHAGQQPQTICIRVAPLVKWMRKEGYDLPGGIRTAHQALAELFPAGVKRAKRYSQPLLGIERKRPNVFDTGLEDLE